MRDQKQDLRIQAIRRRNSLPPSEARARSDAIQSTAMELEPYVTAQLIALYSPIGNEVSTERIRDHALKSEKSVYYPGHGDSDVPTLIQIRSVGDLQPGRYGILYPGGNNVLEAKGSGDLVVFVPGLAFDFHGRRLGRGKGWYDRLIGTLSEGTLIGLAYEFQVLESVPVVPQDQRVDYIITERRIIDCARADRAGRDA